MPGLKPRAPGGRIQPLPLIPLLGCTWTHPESGTLGQPGVRIQTVTSSLVSPTLATPTVASALDSELSVNKFASQRPAGASAVGGKPERRQRQDSGHTCCPSHGLTSCSITITAASGVNATSLGCRLQGKGQRRQGQRSPERKARGPGAVEAPSPPSGRGLGAAFPSLPLGRQQQKLCCAVRVYSCWAVSSFGSLPLLHKISSF